MSLIHSLCKIVPLDFTQSMRICHFCQQKVMMTSCEAGGTSFLGTPSQGAGGTPIRPLTAAYRAVSSDFSVSSDVYYYMAYLVFQNLRFMRSLMLL